MPGIVPRWEWRTFGSRFGIAETRFADLTPTGVQESDEVYLCRWRGDNVKIRDDLMDIKVLREIDARWARALGARDEGRLPPLARGRGADVRVPSAAPPDLAREAYTFRQFVDELVVPSGLLRAVEVHKRRVRYVVDGCTSEVSDVVVGGIPSRTIAIESEDAAAVLRAVASVALDGYLNMSYAVGLPAILDHRPERFAVHRRRHELDQVPRRRAPARRRLAPVVDRAEITRLGEGLGRATRSTPEAHGPDDRGHGGHGRRGPAERRARRSRRWARPASGWPPTREAVIEAMRRATGSGSGRSRGDEESRLAFLAVKERPRAGRRAARRVRHRWRQHQFTFGHGDQVDERFSVDVGAVRFTEQFGLADAVPTRRSTRRSPRSRRARPAGRPRQRPTRWSGWAAR